MTDLADNASPPPRWICLDASAVDDVDYSAAEALRALRRLLRDRGIRLVFANVEDLLEADSDYGLRGEFGEDVFFDGLDKMMTAYLEAAAAETA